MGHVESCSSFPSKSLSCFSGCFSGIHQTNRYSSSSSHSHREEDNFLCPTSFLSAEAAFAVFAFLPPRSWCQISASCQALKPILRDAQRRRQLINLVRPALVGAHESLLHYVMRCGHADGVFCMLFGQFDVRNPLEMLQERDQTNGFTPLMNAAYYGCEASTLALLLASRADPNAQSHRGGTALSSACYVVSCPKGLRHIELLLEYRADPLIGDNAGDNALHCAAYGGTQDAVEMILCAGVSINVHNNGGWSALRYAYQEGHNHLVSYLKERGAAE